MGAGGRTDSPSPNPEYSCIVGLGDSMIDDGNLVLAAEDFAPDFGPVMPDYHHNNMTNGPVIVEYLANHLGLDVPSPSLLGGSLEKAICITLKASLSIYMTLHSVTNTCSLLIMSFDD